MPRVIHLGCGKLTICFDHGHVMRDMYFPNIGQENHIDHSHSIVVVWIDNQFQSINPKYHLSISQLFEPDTLVYLPLKQIKSGE